MSEAASTASHFIAPGQTPASITKMIAGTAFGYPLGSGWWIAFGVALAMTGLFGIAILLLLIEGVGIWGNNVPVTWALDIVSYDWWIGIASGALLISAAFVLLDVEWRGALNRIMETGALLATIAAGFYPIIHLGRPWFFFWTLPYPNTYLLWPQFRSPLYWDAMDIICFLGVSLIFWSTGILPDLAMLRDRAIESMQANGGQGRWRAQLYGIAALGWRGSANHWHRWSQAYRITAILGILLVISLQTGASVMFAGTVEPGWHDTLLPVAFFAAAIYSGVAFMAMACVILRGAFALQPLITSYHFEIIGKMLLGLGLLNLYCEAAECFFTLMGNNSYEIAVLTRRFNGQHAWAAWTVMVLAFLPVQIFWFRAMRQSGMALLLAGFCVVAGLYADHFMVIVVTLQHDFLPSAAQTYQSDLWGVLTFFGSIGLFFVFALLALRYLPLVSGVACCEIAFARRDA